jgi:tetratricopeptide (TPR) repeat protein
MATGFRLLAYSALLISLVIPNRLHAQASGAGKIIGDIRISRGDFPDHPVLVSLETRGSVISSAYTDSQGRFGFYDLIGNPYKVTVNDDAYELFSVNVDVNPANSPMNFVQVNLVLRTNAKKDPLPGRVAGSNPALIDSAEYNRQFSKKTLKEFEKGVEADHKGNADDAIQHYLKALSYSPDFYPAHNNLGSVYLSRKNFEAAQNQFEAALKANQNDGQAYFNLANVCILTGQLSDAQNFLNDGLRRQPDSAMGKFLLGTLDIRAGKLPEAETALRQAVELDHAMAQPRLQLVNLFLKEGRKADAVDQLHAFLTAIPSSPFSSQARQMLQRLETPATQAGVNPQPVPKN